MDKMTAKLFIITSLLIVNVKGHGRLLEPPSRASMWRLGFKSEVNYNDNQLFCGGVAVQYEMSGGRCGVCGDPYNGLREHEAGGKYANGIIGRQYKVGQVIDVIVQITANHLGSMAFTLCPNNDPNVPATEDCFNRFPLYPASGGDFRIPVTRSMVGGINVKLQLPAGVQCSQCILRWIYTAGNSWGVDHATGQGCTGCGNQEQFYACSDITIGDAQPQWDTVNGLRPVTPPPTIAPPAPVINWNDVAQFNNIAPPPLIGASNNNGIKSSLAEFLSNDIIPVGRLTTQTTTQNPSFIERTTIGQISLKEMPQDPPIPKQDTNFQLQSSILYGTNVKVPTKTVTPTQGPDLLRHINLDLPSSVPYNSKARPKKVIRPLSQNVNVQIPSSIPYFPKVTFAMKSHATTDAPHVQNDIGLQMPPSVPSRKTSRTTAPLFKNFVDIASLETPTFTTTTTARVKSNAELMRELMLKKIRSEKEKKQRKVDVWFREQLAKVNKRIINSGKVRLSGTPAPIKRRLVYWVPSTTTQSTTTSIPTASTTTTTLAPTTTTEIRSFNQLPVSERIARIKASVENPKPSPVKEADARSGLTESLIMEFLRTMKSPERKYFANKIATQYIENTTPVPIVDKVESLQGVNREHLRHNPNTERQGSVLEYDKEVTPKFQQANTTVEVVSDSTRLTTTTFKTTSTTEHIQKQIASGQFNWSKLRNIFSPRRQGDSQRIFDSTIDTIPFDSPSFKTANAYTVSGFERGNSEITTDVTHTREPKVNNMESTTPAMSIGRTKSPKTLSNIEGKSGADGSGSLSFDDVKKAKEKFVYTRVPPVVHTDSKCELIKFTNGATGKPEYITVCN